MDDKEIKTSDTIIYLEGKELKEQPSYYSHAEIFLIITINPRQNLWRNIQKDIYDEQNKEES